jgi:pimeloyl-ACP methyl ester carboxylesterase
MALSRRVFRPVRALLGIGALLILLAAGLPLIHAQGDPPVGRVDVGGYALFIECMGQPVEGRPTVVMLHSLGSQGRTFLLVQPDLAEMTQVCVYDRAGSGGSDPAPTPRTADNIVVELHTLLVNAGVPGPYILVGHTWGGLFARYYAYQYPDEVAGLVLIDALHEDQEVRFADLGMTEEIERNRTTWSQPEGVTLDDRDANFDLLRATRASASDPLPSLEDTPLVVIAHGKFQAAFNQTPEQAMDRYLVWMDLQFDLSTISTNSVLVVARESTDLVYNQQPELVIEAVRAVLEAVESNFPVIFVDPQPVAAADTAAPVMTPTPEIVADPLFMPGAQVTIPDSGFIYQLRDAPGSMMPGGVCNLGMTATVGQTMLAVDGRRWLELDCSGNIGWGLESDFTG